MVRRYFALDELRKFDSQFTWKDGVKTKPQCFTKTGTPYDFFDDLHSVILLKEIVNSWEDEIDEAVTEGLNGDVLTLVRKFVPRGVSVRGISIFCVRANPA